MQKPDDSLGSLESRPPQEPDKPRIHTLVLGPEEERRELLQALRKQLEAPHQHPVLPDLGALQFDTLRLHQLAGENPEARSLKPVLCNAEQTARIAETWKYLIEGQSARCHHPGFALELLLDGEVRFHASLCWQCHNIRMTGMLAPAQWASFDAGAPAAQSLLRYCKEVMQNA
jgi:hypothetical protein